jgi:glycosyltransferase involved in cell wall biosynthesis
LPGPSVVLFLIDDLEVWGGSEQQLLRLTTRLDRRLFTPEVVVLGRSGLRRAFQDAGVVTASLPVRRILGWSGLLGVARLRALLRRRGARLLVTYHTAADILGGAVAAVGGPPVLSCRRDAGFTKRPRHVAVQRRLNRFLAGMISVSAAVARAVLDAEGFPLERIRVIWNGEDLQEFRPGSSPLRRALGLPEGGLVLCCVASLSPVKDQATLLAAFARLRERHPEACLLLVGEGPERARLEAAAAPLGWSVRFLGHRADVADLLRACDVYVQTSTTEGFSNALVQAMATALPVVATRVGGNVELLDGCGALVAPGDPEAAAEALLALAADRDRRRALGLRGRRRVEERCSVEGMVSAYAAAFEQALAGTFTAQGGAP